jgi:xanthine dehydrogenase accessory factor
MTHDLIPETALDWYRAGRGAALATVVETWGSAPRQAGSQLAISGAGDIMGSVSGGCVEGAVVTEALDALADGIPRLLTFGVSDETAFSVGLACGGTIRVLVEPVGTDGSALPPDLLAELVSLRAARRQVAYAVTLSDWSRALLRTGADAAADARLRSDKAGPEEDGRFIAPHNPPQRLIVVGAVHIAQPLVAMARLAGYDPTLIDPRATFGAAERFVGETILDDWPDEALTALAPDARTAIVTLTHDPKLDDPAIRFALRSDAFYLGCLGSKKTHAARVARLQAEGFSDAEIARIHAPVGLDIGAKTPAEIAISVLAQITAVLRRG